MYEASQSPTLMQSDRTPRQIGTARDRNFVSVVVPAYNESLILEDNLARLCSYLELLEDEYRWELIIVNDGSSDDTGELADAFASRYNNVYVIHHEVNAGLGQALRTGFECSQGDYVVTLDLDLSYAPEHIERLLTKIRCSNAKIVVASPYMEGGKVSNVPWLRKWLSIWANRFLAVAARRNVATFTGMVRVYDAEFLNTMNFRSRGMEINPEAIHKAMLIGEKVEEIPAHLNWQTHKVRKTSQRKTRRKSSMKILRHTWDIFFYGFVFRPVMFFIIPSLIFFFLAMYSNAWAAIHIWYKYWELAAATPFPDPTDAIALAFQHYPHTFVIGGMLLMLSIQLFSLGVLAAQSKRYFEEVFYLGTSVYQNTRKDRDS